MSSLGWEDRAQAFVSWARTPGHDAYWYYREPFLELASPARRRTLEVGCGEGRVSRDLAASGHRVTGLDAAPTLVAAAAEAHPEGEYVVGAAEELPFPDGAFDLIVAYNSLMDVDDMPRAVAEAGRVLEPGGRLCACTTHPLADAGEFALRDPDEPLVVADSYFRSREYEVTAERDGLRLTFRSRTYPLGAYTRALEDAGFLLDAIGEPRPAPGYRSAARWSRFPQFLHLRAVKP